jgi:hypothetical protein
MLYIRYAGEDYGSTKTTGRVLPKEVFQLSKRNFPQCYHIKTVHAAVYHSHQSQESQEDSQDYQSQLEMMDDSVLIAAMDSGNM